jgi:membrane dipeptidase
VTAPLYVFDAHLDLAMNACRGRDPLQRAEMQPMVEGEIATVGLPDLRAGGVTHLCAAIFCEPSFNGGAGYATADQAYAMARVQLAIYQQWHIAGEIQINGLRGDATAADAVLLMEGADAIRTPDDLAFFAAAGVRVIGMSWLATRYAGGTGQPGPLTPDGATLAGEIDRLNLIHDASHLAEQSFWDLSGIIARPMIASHSNCRAIVGDDPRERHLTDAMIRRIIEHGGMVGINFYDKFLLPAAEFGKRRATLDDVVRHVLHVCDLAGDATHVGLGTDMDGGLGRDNIPQEIYTSADLPKLYTALRNAGLDDTAARGVMGENWRQFFERALGAV